MLKQSQSPVENLPRIVGTDGAVAAGGEDANGTPTTASASTMGRGLHSCAMGSSISTIHNV